MLATVWRRDRKSSSSILAAAFSEQLLLYLDPAVAFDVEIDNTIQQVRSPGRHQGMNRFNKRHCCVADGSPDYRNSWRVGLEKRVLPYEACCVLRP